MGSKNSRTQKNNKRGKLWQKQKKPNCKTRGWGAPAGKKNETGISKRTSWDPIHHKKEGRGRKKDNDTKSGGIFGGGAPK